MDDPNELENENAMKSLTKLFVLFMFIGCFFSFGGKLAAQVQGSVFLAGQNDHSGISVIFTSTSTSGQSDTTLSQTDGSYSITLNPGVYFIQMEAPGYQTHFYNQNQSLLLNGSEVLDSVTLQPGPVKYISGPVADTLYNDTIYIANGDLSIPASGALYIQAGTELRFEPDFTFNIEGKLTAVGTAVDPIVFTLQSIGSGPESWAGIRFNKLEVVSEMQYCIVEKAEDLLNVSASFTQLPHSSTPHLTIQNSIFREGTYGIGLTASQPILVSNNEVYNFDVYGIAFTEGGNPTGPENYVITCNKVHDGDNYGIFTFLTSPNAYVAGNEVYDINGIAIRINRQNGGNVTVENNVAYNSAQGIAETATNSPPTIIRNNVVFNNSLGISLTGEGGSIIQMNVVTNNTYGINQFNSLYGTPSDLSYNLIALNDTNFSPQVNIPFVGVPITTNVNGDSTDAYFNLALAPQIDSMTYLPLPNSPVIDAGDPAFLDWDGTTRDIGIYGDSLACWVPLILSRKVFPGDANYDQLANVWDLLPIGVKFGTTGPARPNASLNWAPQASSSWTDSLASGINLKHVDCDGNGLINADDTLGIAQNYNLEHNAQKTTTRTDGIPLYMDMPLTYAPGDTLAIPIILGTTDSVASDLYGLAFSMTYDSSLVEPNSIELQFSSSWLGVDDQDMLTMYYDGFDDSRLEVGMVRTDAIEVTGYGQIATMIVVLDDDIAKRIPDFWLNWLEVSLIHYDESPLDVNAVDGVIIPETSPPTSIEDLLARKGIRYFPNPAQDLLQLTYEKSHKDCLVQVLDMTGRTAIHTELSARESSLTLEVGELTRGMYVLQIQEEGQAPLSVKVMLD